MNKEHEAVDKFVIEIKSLVDINGGARTVTPGVKNRRVLGVEAMSRVCAIIAELYGDPEYEKIFSEKYPNEHYNLQKYR